jgi:hypothetical protein
VQVTRFAGIIRCNLFPELAMLSQFTDSEVDELTSDFIRLNEASPPVPVPPGHVGPVMLPGTGRMVWWTGRVAIGLRHEPSLRRNDMLSQSALWLQDLMLGGARRARA